MCLTVSGKECLVSTPVAEFSESICSILKLICGSDDGVLTLFITENDTCYKSNVYKKGIMQILYQFKIEFITYLKVKGK